MAKAFHGRIDDTLDALIIFEGCRQGILPTLTRRLLAAERGDATHLPSSLESEGDQQDDDPDISRTSQSAPQRSYSAVKSKNSGVPKQTPLIMPGSVFVFDERESGIYRWTDGRIWSPSRICGNFLVYRELLRKVPNQKCHTPSDKARMKNGGALKDKLLKQKVEEDGLTVMGCVKGTFVLKKDGLIKKTICVKGTTVPMSAELQRVHGKKCNKAGHPPGFTVGDMQHLVCYEKSGAMTGLHRPRDYKELRDLTLSKSFITTQKYRNPIDILPPLSADDILDPFDEYVSAERISEHTQRTTPKRSASAKTEARTSKEEKRFELEFEDGSSELSDAEDYADDDEIEPDGRERTADVDYDRSSQDYQSGERSLTQQEPNQRENAESLMVSTDVYDVVRHPYLTRNAQRRIQNLQQERASRVTPYSRSTSEKQSRRGAFPVRSDTHAVRRESGHLHSHVSPRSDESHFAFQPVKNGVHRVQSPLSEYDLAPDRLPSVIEKYPHHGPSQSSGSSQSSGALAFLDPNPAPGRNESPRHLEDFAPWHLAYATNFNDRDQHFGDIHQVPDAYGSNGYYEPTRYSPTQGNIPPPYLVTGPTDDYHIGTLQHQQTLFHAPGIVSSSLNAAFHPQAWYSSDIPNQAEPPIVDAIPSASEPCGCCSFAVCSVSENTSMNGPLEPCKVKTEILDVRVAALPLVDTQAELHTVQTSVEYYGLMERLQVDARPFPAASEESNEMPFQQEALKRETPLDPQAFSPDLESQEFPIDNFDWSTVDQDQFNVLQRSSPSSSDYAEARRALGANEYMLHMQHHSLSQSSQTRLYPNQIGRRDDEPPSDASTEPPSAYCQGDGVHEDLIFYSEIRSRVGLLEPSSDSASTHPMSDPAPSDIEDCKSNSGVIAATVGNP